MLTTRLRLLKTFDRLAGRGLLSLTARCCRLEGFPPKPGGEGGCLAAQALDPERIRRILVIRPGGIGDAVLCFPMLTALRERFPLAAIDVLAESRNRGVFAANDLVSRRYRYDRLLPADLARVLAIPYDLVIDTEQYHRLSSLVALLTRAPFRCGFDTLGRGRFLTHRVRYRETEYEIYSFLNLAAAVTGGEVSFDPARPFLEIARRWVEWAQGAVFQRIGDAPLVVIVPATGKPTRLWPAERYRTAVQWLLNQGAAVCLLGGRESLPAAAAIARGVDSALFFNLVAQTSLPESCGILRNAALYLGADCGVLHLAVAVGTPTVHLFGSGILEKWAPVGPDYHLVHKELPCSPCTRHGETPPCSYDAACMKAITTAEVLRTVARALQRGWERGRTRVGAAADTPRGAER